MVRLNSKGFGGFLAHKKGTRDYAFMIKGAEVSELQWNDVEAARYAGADQVNEVGEDVFRQCVEMGVFENIKRGGRLTLIGHSQGAPSAQLLGVYLITRALEEGLLTEEEALQAIQVRGFGGMGARGFLDRLRGKDGLPLKVRSSVLQRIDAVTYVVRGDELVQEVPEPYVGSTYIVDTPDPDKYQVTEVWARTPSLKAHARSAYKAANYATARRDTRSRKGVDRTVKDALGVTAAADFVGGLADDAADWFNGAAGDPASQK